MVDDAGLEEGSQDAASRVSGDHDQSDWISVVESHSLAEGEIVSVEYQELDLVVWRGTDGIACVMEARCPHQWSHLGAEGAIDGCEIVCLSHWWRFDAEGVGTKQAMNGRRDPKSNITTFKSRESNGWIQAVFQ